MSSATYRIRKELNCFQANAPWGMMAWLLDDDLHRWHAVFNGPIGSPYEDGQYCVIIHIPTLYPFQVPHVRFVNRIYHPMVNNRGDIWIDILERTWFQTKTIRDILLDIREMLANPDSDGALMPDIRDLMDSDYDGFLKAAREHTEKYAYKDLLEFVKPENPTDEDRGVPRKAKYDENGEELKPWEENLPINF